MYGMVNKAIQELVCSQFGEEVWERVKVSAGIDHEVFISNESYPDDLTYRLVGATASVSGLKQEEVLHAFGEWWVLKTARHGYGELLQAGGKTLSEFLINLPNFHTRVMMIYPNLRPPKFEVSEVAERSLRLHYFTHRRGLTHFLIGLVSGLGIMFGTPATAKVTASTDDGAEHDEFLVEW